MLGFFQDQYFSDLVTESSQESNLAKIHIDTISSYSGFGGGIYKMTSVKELIGTEDFLEMEENNCIMESHRECMDRNMRKKCGCRLWEDSLVQVGSYLITVEKANISLNIFSGWEVVQPVRKRLHRQ